MPDSLTVAIAPATTDSGNALAVFWIEDVRVVYEIYSGLFENGKLKDIHAFSLMYLQREILQATQKSRTNRLLMKPFYGRRLQSFGINSNQTSNHKRTQVSPEIPGVRTAGSVSADGKMLVEGIVKASGAAEMVMQPLFNNAERHGPSSIIEMSSPVSSVDCSNDLGNGRRIVLYRTQRTEGTATFESQVFMQQIHSATGKPIGGAVDLTNRRIAS